METIGILGTGRMGIRLACMFAEAGRDVILASRDVERSSRLVLGLKNSNLRSGSYADAVAAEFVLPAMFLRDGMLNILEPLRDQLDGKISQTISVNFSRHGCNLSLPNQCKV